MGLGEGLEPEEVRKRRREIVIGIALLVIFLVLTWVEFRLFSISQELPIVHSIFFLGLVNFNIVLLLLLLFLIFRNVVKAFAEGKGRWGARSLKQKLMAAFCAFSFIPTVLIFAISMYYVNGSFDKWFSVKMSRVLKDALEVTNAYYVSAKRRNYHFGRKVAETIDEKVSSEDRDGLDRTRLLSAMESLREKYGLHAVEYYPDLKSERLIVLSQDEAIPKIPKVDSTFLEKGISKKAELSRIEPIREGNLVQVVVPVNKRESRGVVVVSTFLPLSLTSRMDDIAIVYEDFRDVNPLEYPIKSIFLTILILMTLVIILGGTWFGIHLAKQLSGPLELVGEATQQVTRGRYQEVDVISGSVEINQLVDNFNAMILDLEHSRSALEATLSQLDERSRYIEVVLSNVSTGVVAVDQEDRITTLNPYAGKLLNIKPEDYIGKRVREILGGHYYRDFDELVQTMKHYKAVHLKKEIRVEIQGRAVPLQVTLSLLFDENRSEIGKVLVLDDLTHVVNAQRAAAWTEVARRIAHEIKNPLTPIKLSAQRLQKKFSHQIKDQAFRVCTETIIEQVDEMKKLVDEFTHFARLPEAQPEMGSLNQIIDSTMVLYQTGHKGCKFQFKADRELPEFKFDASQIKRVLVNLLDNAVGAVGHRSSGEVEVWTEYDKLLKMVRITIRDNGSGVKQEDQERIFEPYFSTKEGGTGLGLAIVKRIIEDHNGFVRFFSAPNVGTRVVVELPVLVEEQRTARMETFSTQQRAEI